MKLTVIMDNHGSEQKSLTAEHGLSFLLDTEKSRILFDFGAGAVAYENAVKLNIDSKTVDYAIGSHGHYDHAGGYPCFVQNGLKVPFYTGEGYFEEQYAFDGMKATYLGCGFDEDWMTQQHLEHRVCKDLLTLEEGCYLVGNFKRHYEFETIHKRFVLRKNGRWEQDLFEDEICLVLNRPEGLVVVVGCSHPGILNILSTVQEKFQRPIQAVFGGTHLVEADPERIEKTLEIMEEMGVGLLGFNHCSGDQLQEILERKTEIKHCYLGAGDCIYL